jgi:hypothetical protein
LLVGVIGLRNLFTTRRSASYAGRMTESSSEEVLLETRREGRVRMQVNYHPLMSINNLSG